VNTRFQNLAFKSNLYRYVTLLRAQTTAYRHRRGVARWRGEAVQLPNPDEPIALESAA
jgi:hypothetical protein